MRSHGLDESAEIRDNVVYQTIPENFHYLEKNAPIKFKIKITNKILKAPMKNILPEHLINSIN